LSAGKRGWNFRDAQAECRGLDDHLGGEFHPQGSQPQPVDRILAKCAKPAMKVAYRALEKQASNSAKHGIAQVAMQGRHRARQDSPAEPVAHHEVESFAKFGEERVHLGEIVSVVGIAHQNKSPVRRRDASLQGAPIPPRLNWNHSRPEGRGDLLRTIRAPIIGDNHFATDSMALHGVDRLLDANANRRLLVQARHHHGELNCISRLLEFSSDLRFRRRIHEIDCEPPASPGQSPGFKKFNPSV
jgi:hypothetical protein